MSYSIRILLIIKDKDQRKLYHEFLVNSGYVVYLCDELANALLQLLMFPSINAVILDTAFSQRSLEHFLKTLADREQWKQLAILVVDTADKGNLLKNVVKNRPFLYTQEIDPQEIILSLGKLLKHKSARSLNH